MNRVIVLLFKNYLWNQYRFNDFRKNTAAKPTRRSLGFIIGFGCLALMFVIYSFIAAYGLSMAGLPDLVPAYAVAATGIATLFFTLLKTNGFLFGYRDYDLLMSLPVSTKDVVASRFWAVYSANLLFAMLFMLPMGIGYALWVKPGILFYLYWLAGIIFAPLLPTTIAVIVGAVIMALASRFKYTKLISTTLSLLAAGGAVLLSMSSGAIGTNLEANLDIAALGTSVYRSITHLYPPAALFTAAIAENSLVKLLLFTGLSFLVYQIFIQLMSVKYKAINTAVNGHVKKSDYRLSALNTASPLKTLYRKELKRFFTSTPYVTNCGMGVLMALLFTLVLTVIGPAALEDSLSIPGFSTRVNQYAPFLISLMLGLSCPASASLSLEGRNLWILQSSPIPLTTIFNSKILTNLTLTLPTALLSAVLLAFRLRPEAANLFLLFAIPITCSCFSAVWGMFMNIRMPRYDWETEISVIKQSGSAFAGMLGGILIILAAMGLSFFPPGGLDYRLWSCVVMAVLWLLCFFSYHSIRRVRTLG